jgi:DNA polymerase III subunit beta
MVILKTSREPLLKALSIMQGIFDKKHLQSICSQVWIHQRSPVLLEMRATDLELEIRLPLEAELFQEGAEMMEPCLFLPARKCLDIIRVLPEEEALSIRKKGQKIELQTRLSRYVLGSIADDSYPLLTDDPVMHSLSIEEGVLKKILEHTRFAMLQQSARYYLNAVQLSFSSEGLKAVATDGHRLVLHEYQQPFSLTETLSIIVPQKAVIELQRLLHDSSDLMTLELTENTFSVKTKAFFFKTKHIVGRYPSYQSLLHEKDKVALVLDREPLKKCLQRASVLLTEKNQGAFFRFTDNHLKIYAKNAQKEESEESLPIDYTGEDFEIALNIVYLLEYLIILKTEKVSLFFIDDQHPCRVIPEGAFFEGHHNSYFIMPMCL